MSFGHLQLVIRPPQGRFGWWGVAGISLALAVFLWWAALGSQINAANLWNGIPYMWDFLVRMMPPNPEFLDRLWKPALESLQVAVWGTLLGVVIALPICFFAARNLSPSPVVFHATRQLLNCMRGINEIILALIFVAAIGLGPFAGVLALAIHGAGMLGKFFAEAMEDIDEGPLEAFRSAGVGPFKTFFFGVLPQVLPTWLGTIFYRLETNVRQSTVLGMVGAGGIGFELVSSMKLFKYQDTATCILVILAMVLIADLVSSRVRALIR
ncbi:phosphate ABC transporter permease [Bosea thiooxidans]|uniref:Phosphate ABC transporter permease n=1 Tax=Bosea thiooxidans TaxID=53254 RepID=A0A0Q3KT96_9HYPH|nr:phosphonate ABC transporter, permease protein PhnE [Bosea thiooxidans]KQK27668.1 phosphate ABC transporter permease [Bosea thiooxidans]SKB44863.1 phosphonate transport system permease protein [Bosea thiooxidans]